jgi:flagellar hook-length control protein FliK
MAGALSAAAAAAPALPEGVTVVSTSSSPAAPSAAPAGGGPTTVPGVPSPVAAAVVPDETAGASTPTSGTATAPASGAPTGGAVPAPAPGGSGAGTTDGGESGSTGTPAQSALPAAGPAAPAATVAAPREAAGATGAATAQTVGAQVARQVAVLRGVPDGSHSMTLVLTPETLGRVEIQVTVSQGTVDLTLRGAHEHGRAALVDALPDLRRDLEAAGLTCSRLDVDRDTGASWSAQQQTAQQWTAGERGTPQDRTDARSRSWVRPADTDEGRSGPVPSPTATSSGVDYRV